MLPPAASDSEIAASTSLRTISPDSTRLISPPISVSVPKVLVGSISVMVPLASVWKLALPSIVAGP
jgi:hypothetical protein